MTVMVGFQKALVSLQKLMQAAMPEHFDAPVAVSGNVAERLFHYIDLGGE